MSNQEELNERALQAEIVRLKKMIQVLMDRAERIMNIQGSDFSLFETTITLEEQVHRRTQELEAALRENERITGALRQSEERLRHVLEGANDGFWDWNIVTGETLFSNRWLEMRGYSPEDIAPHISSWEKRVHPDDLPHCKRALQAHFSGETSRYQAEYRMRTQDGEWQWVLSRGKVTVRDAEGRPLRIVGTHTDITDRKQMQAALQELAIRDLLTGLFNRRYLDETLPRELSRCQRRGEPLVVAMLDLDRFKRFNDAYGHEAGDIVLQMIGLSLRQSLRSGDIACRYGGEELTVVMSGVSLDDAKIRLDKLRQTIRQLHIRYRECELPAITVSIGVAIAESEKIDATALLNRADAALYQAKKQGRNRVVVASGPNDDRPHPAKP